MTEAMPFLQKYDITFLRPPTILRGGYSICLLGPRYHAYGVFALGLLDRVCYRQYRQCYASVRLPLCNRRADI